MSIKNRYIQPYHPQTNDKIERFWKIIEEEVFEETCFENYAHLQKELYLYYYNHERSPLGIGRQTPAHINQNC